MSNAKDSAKKKVTAKANPVEAYGKAASDPIRDPMGLVKNSDKDDDMEPGSMFTNSGDEALQCGYSAIKADLDMHDNDRNFHRVRPDVSSTLTSPDPHDYDYTQITPAKGYGAKHGRLLPQGEDYED